MLKPVADAAQDRRRIAALLARDNASFDQPVQRLVAKKAGVARLKSRLRIGAVLRAEQAPSNSLIDT